MHQLRKRLTYANVMSSLAVFLVLGGATAFAATKIGSSEIKANAIVTGKIAKEAVAQGKIKVGAVGNSRLGDGSVSAQKIAANAVTGAAIADASVTAPKLAPNAVTGTGLANGSVGATKLAPESVTPAALANGSVGTTALAAGSVTAGKLGEVVRVTGESTVTNVIGDKRTASVDCPAGYVAIGGGAAWETPSGNDSTLAGLLRVNRPIPSGNGAGLPTGWEATGEQTETLNRVLRVYAICLA
jgi:trimeric autotransporter adhesin